MGGWHCPLTGQGATRSCCGDGSRCSEGGAEGYAYGEEGAEGEEDMRSKFQ